LTGGCGSVNATGTITVTQDNTVGSASATPTLCINTALTAITHTTTGANGIGTATGLPTGVTASWASNTITISGTPTVSGTFTYTIPLTDGCGTVNAMGTITIVLANTASAASSTPTLCTNTPLTEITHTTTVATGIGTASGLPAGVTASWASDTIRISGTPTASGTFTYTIPLTGGCGTVNASGTIFVTSDNPFTLDPDVNITYVNVLINGSVASNDDVSPCTTYGNQTARSTNPLGGVLVLQPNGTYTFTSPNPGTYYYEVDVCPVGVTSGCPKTLLKIEVLSLDSAAKLSPIANHDVAYTQLNTPVLLLTFNNDAALEPGKTLNPASLDTIAGLGSRNGTITFNRTTGDITFTPRTGFTGIETYYYKICDNQSPSLCDTAIQNIYVLPITPPNSTQAADDYRTSFSGVTITGSVKTNDIDPEGHPTSVTAQTITLSGKGTLVLLTDGSYTFTPVPGFYGPVSYPYTICDNQSPVVCALATLYILVKPFLPDPDMNITYVNVLVSGSIATNDEVPPGTNYKNPLPKNTNPPGGILTLQSDGNYTFKSENLGVY
jgi:hypothetical protein